MGVGSWCSLGISLFLCELRESEKKRRLAEEELVSSILKVDVENSILMSVLESFNMENL